MTSSRTQRGAQHADSRPRQTQHQAGYRCGATGLLSCPFQRYCRFSVENSDTTPITPPQFHPNFGYSPRTSLAMLLMWPAKNLGWLFVNSFRTNQAYVITNHQRYRQTDRQTDRRTKCNDNTALCTRASRLNKSIGQKKILVFFALHRHLMLVAQII